MNNPESFESMLAREQYSLDERHKQAEEIAKRTTVVEQFSPSFLAHYRASGYYGIDAAYEAVTGPSPEELEAELQQADPADPRYSELRSQARLARMAQQCKDKDARQAERDAERERRTVRTAEAVAPVAVDLPALLNQLQQDGRTAVSRLEKAHVSPDITCGRLFTNRGWLLGYTASDILGEEVRASVRPWESVAFNEPYSYTPVIGAAVTGTVLGQDGQLRVNRELAVRFDTRDRFVQVREILQNVRFLRIDRLASAHHYQQLRGLLARSVTLLVNGDPLQ